MDSWQSPGRESTQRLKAQQLHSKFTQVSPTDTIPKGCWGSWTEDVHISYVQLHYITALSTCGKAKQLEVRDHPLTVKSRLPSFAGTTRQPLQIHKGPTETRVR